MSIREMFTSDKNVPVKKEESPIAALQNEVNRLFRDFLGEGWPHWSQSFQSSFATTPATDIIENEKEFRITAEVPGMDAKDLYVTISHHYVGIKGEKKEEAKEEKEGYFRQERSYGSFQRMIALPSDIADTDKAEARIEKGVLTVTIPKKAGAAQPRVRQVNIKQAA